MTRETTVTIEVSEVTHEQVVRVEGSLVAQGMRFGLICSRFNEFITSSLLQGAKDALSRLGVANSEILEIMVPGALEIPQAARALARTGYCDAIIALGAVIRGDTAHFDVVVNQSASGLSAVESEYAIVVTNAILTTDTIEQAIDRSGAKAGNKGYEAAMVAVEMVDLFRKIRAYGKGD